MELDPKACQEYLDYMRAYNRGAENEASYHQYDSFSLLSYDQFKCIGLIVLAYLLVCGIIYIII